jgi:hypothetical protein
VKEDAFCFVLLFVVMAVYFGLIFYIGNHRPPRDPNVHCHHVMMAVVCE